MKTQIGGNINIIFLLLFTACGFFNNDFTDLERPDDYAFSLRGTAFPNTSTDTIVLHDRRAFTSDGIGSIRVFDISNEWNPFVIQDYFLGNDPIRRIAVNHSMSRLYVAAGSSGVFTLHWNYTQDKIEMGSNNNVNARDLSFQELGHGDGFVAVLLDREWQLYRLGATNTLMRIDYHRYTWDVETRRIHIQDNWVYVFLRNRIDIFQIVGNFTISFNNSISLDGGDFIDFTINEGNEMIAVTRRLIYFIDITMPTHPLVHSRMMAFIPVTIHAENNRLFMTTTGRNLSVYTLDDPNNIEVSRLSLRHRVPDLVVRDGLVYLASEKAGLLIYEFDFDRRK